MNTSCTTHPFASPPSDEYYALSSFARTPDLATSSLTSSTCSPSDGTILSTTTPTSTSDITSRYYGRTHEVINRIQGMMLGCYHDPYAIDQNQENAMICHQQHHHHDFLSDSGMEPPPQQQQHQASSYWASPMFTGAPLRIPPTSIVHGILPFHQAPLFQQPNDSKNPDAASYTTEYLPSPSSYSNSTMVAPPLSTAPAPAPPSTLHHHQSILPTAPSTTNTTHTTASISSSPPFSNDDDEQQGIENNDQAFFPPLETSIHEEQEHNHPQPQSSPEERPYGCTDCASAFGRRQDLKRHISSVHKKVFPYECIQCHRLFSRRDSLLRHERNSCHRPAIAPHHPHSSSSTVSSTSSRRSNNTTSSGRRNMQRRRRRSNQSTMTAATKYQRSSNTNTITTCSGNSEGNRTRSSSRRYNTMMY
ncbi:hypothetical protein K492DRAFT_175931 [Lichtheimia hyalospora FSU 10163]|nr:hypothetical protein K492DRAFT_175931 [Lichtheimia hyalospora FSU 10163]